MFPTIIVRADRTANKGAMTGDNVGKAIVNTRIRAANPAAFAPMDIKAVTGEGAPWYTSGVHMWKGTTATLKLKPTSSNPAPIVTRPVSAVPF